MYTANPTLTFTGTSSRGTAATQAGVVVTLEDPSFVPTSTNLPVMTINTAGSAPVDSQDTYVSATLSITDSSNPANSYSGMMQIKGHGNSTGAMPKKPYRLNLDSDAPLLGMTSDSNWIMLANYDDQAMIRNDVSFKISQMAGLAWTPSSAFVR